MTKPHDADEQKPARRARLTVKEYAAEVRQHPKTIYRRIAAGQIPARREGGSIRLKAPVDDEDD
jgi:excisionase family DNA binding protein